jgi:hypothetical protein
MERIRSINKYKYQHHGLCIFEMCRNCPLSYFSLNFDSDIYSLTAKKTQVHKQLCITMTIDQSQRYGKRLIPQILDSLALAEPDRTIYSLASFSNDTADFQLISARAFAKAVDKTAWWLHDQIKGQDGTPHGGHDEGHGEAKKKVLPIGYIGPRKSKRPGLYAQWTCCL